MNFRAHARATLALGLPLIGGHLAQFAIGFTDTLMMGWYGVPELAALTLASSLFFTLFLFGSGFAWAVMPMVATFAAQGDDVSVRRATRMALWLSGLYFAAVLPVLWFSAPILRGLGQSPDIAALAQIYLRIASLGMLPALGVMVLKNYLAGLEDTRVAMVITLAAAALNVPANYALVFGNWGAPEMGIAGAAVASVLVQTVSLLLVVAYALRKRPEHQLFVRFWRADGEMFSRVFRLGLPIGLTTLAEVAMFAAAALPMGWLGNVPLAAHGVALQITSATFMMQVGLSNAATVRVGNALGRRDLGHLLAGARVVVVLGAVGVALSMALFLLLPETLVGAFVDPDDPARDEIIATGKRFLFFAALFQLADAAQVLHLGLLRGLQDTRVPMIMASVAYWVIGLPATLLFAFPLGLGGIGVWLGLTLGLAAAAALLIWRFWTRGAVLAEAQISAA
ncbi:MATE family efflux transporter [Ponticoccus alexandrii]|nr:MATE family efflux transporter [Ponticoccus alexandrii]